MNSIQKWKKCITVVITLTFTLIADLGWQIHFQYGFNYSDVYDIKSC